MNKKIIALIIVILVIAVGVSIFIFSSSKNKELSSTNINSVNSNLSEKEEIGQDENTTDTENSSNSNGKTAVVYFSATGNTEKVAGYIKDATNGDIFEIEPKEKYTDDDLDYNDKNSRSTKEQNDSSVRPEIANNIDTDSYDVIYLGYPIWWGDAPRIILTFLDNHDLSGKTVIPFCTSGGSGISRSVNYFKNNYKNVNWLDGKRLKDSQSEVTNWVNSLNY